MWLGNKTVRGYKSWMKITWTELVMSGEGSGLEELLEDWRWLVGPGMKVVLVTAMGDLFLASGSGEVVWLDTRVGQLFEAADSVEAFQKGAQEDENLVAWFMPEIVAGLIEDGKQLGKGQVYGFKQPPVLGGALEMRNVQVMDAAAHFSMMGQIHEQVRNLPEGSPVRITFK
jgi:hypothetical protein